MKRPCDSCPFIYGDMMGCLPEGWEAREFFKEHGVSISCHSDETRHCHELVAWEPEAASRPVHPYSLWYRGVKP